MVIESGCSPDSGDSFYLSDLSKQDKPWDSHRFTAEQVEQLYHQAGFTRYAERINQCSRLLEFAFKADDAGQVALRLYGAKFCRVRFCPVCVWRRSMMWKARFFKFLPKLIEDYPTARFVFLTLTVRSCEISELKSTLAWMNNSWKLLTKRKEFPAMGFVKSVEVTRAWDCYYKRKFIFRTGNKLIAEWEKDNKAKLELKPTTVVHPHFHVILMVKSSYFTHGYISQPKWVQLWQSCLKTDYIPQVNIKAIKPSNNAKSYDASELDKNIIDALYETLKYSVKESDLKYDADWLAELTKQLHKTRAIAIGGVFREYLSEDEPEDLIHTDLSTDETTIAEDDPRVWFGWREMVKRYMKQERC